MMHIRRGYVDAPDGQIHYFDTGTPTSAAARSAPPLYCLHATAYSGQTFLPLMQLLATQRRVIALDTPGYGGSDGPTETPTFEHYARALALAIRETCANADAGRNDKANQATNQATDQTTNQTVDIFGYHTGALLAAEIAIQSPELVNKLVLSGVPFFTGDDHAVWRRKLVLPGTLSESFDQFRERWDYFVTHRTLGLSLERAYACFVDELRAYPRDAWSHIALFDYDAIRRLPAVTAPTMVLNFATSLAPFSRAAAALMPNAVVRELPDITGAPFDLKTRDLADAIDLFLSEK
jgi:pimeloyl-ACP methyl ester carboxylesterase